MREISITVFSVIAGAVLASLIMINTIPSEIVNNPFLANYNHEIEFLGCIYFTIPMGGFLGAVTAYAINSWHSQKFKSAARTCFIYGSLLAVPLIFWGMTSVRAQMQNPYPSPEFPHWGEKPHLVQEFLSVSGFPLLWSIFLILWAIKAGRKYRHKAES